MLFPALVPSTAAAERPCTRQAFHKVAKPVYRSASTVTRAERRRVRRAVLCLRRPVSRRIVRRHLARYKRHHDYRVAIARVTPYRGGGSRWAIPWPIVACESGGSWGAYNPSGAAGPYQIMPGWGRPFPVRTAAARLAHHRIAARLWASGAGRSHWVCG